ncbi:hypothetical protein [Paludibaculum fermentans]|uniref:hypothetical protein n=1 Tax=Paludibaculum fermentans TaxID=1473598 RepID=UPI003EBD6D28
MLPSLDRKAQTVWPGLSNELLLAELDETIQFVLPYPTQGEKGPHRTATVLSKHSLAHQSLADPLGLDTLSAAPRG